VAKVADISWQYEQASNLENGGPKKIGRNEFRHFHTSKKFVLRSLGGQKRLQARSRRKNGFIAHKPGHYGPSVPFLFFSPIFARAGRSPETDSIPTAKGRVLGTSGNFLGRNSVRVTARIVPPVPWIENRAKLEW